MVGGKAGEVGCRANVLAIGKEAQRRGATHAHFVVGCETGIELRASRAFRRHLDRLTQNPRYAFGHVNGKFLKPKPAREAAAYLLSYFVAGRGSKAALTEAVENPELPRLPLFVSRQLTQATCTTMRNKRGQRHLWICIGTARPKPAWWSDERTRADVVALALPVADRIERREELRRRLEHEP